MDADLSKERLEEIYLAAIRAGEGPHVAARAVGSTAREMERFISAEPAFAARVDDAKAELLDAVAREAFDAAIERKEPWAIRMILESHRPDEWLKPSDVNLWVGQKDEEIDVGELHKKLAAIDQKGLPSAED